MPRELSSSVTEGRERQSDKHMLFITPPFPSRTYNGKNMGPDYLGGYLQQKGLIKNFTTLDLDVERQRHPGLSIEQLMRMFTPLVAAADIIGLSFLSFQADEAMEIGELCNAMLSQAGR